MLQVETLSLLNELPSNEIHWINTPSIDLVIWIDQWVVLNNIFTVPSLLISWETEIDNIPFNIKGWMFWWYYWAGKEFKYYFDAEGNWGWWVIDSNDRTINSTSFPPSYEIIITGKTLTLKPLWGWSFHLNWTIFW